MTDNWFQVAKKDTGVVYFAKVERSYRESDCRYNSWTVPTEYRVVAAIEKGYVLEPAEGVIGVVYDTNKFWKTFYAVR